MNFLRRFFVCFACAFGLLVSQTVAGYACTSSQIDTGTDCIDEKFTIKTTNLTSNKRTFKFVLSAAGTFYVDWGDGTVDTISRTNDTTPTEYSHVFGSNGVKIIRFGGLATGYNTTTYSNDKDPSGAAIRFGASGGNVSTKTGGTPALIAELGGSIGSVFRSLGDSPDQNPIFFELCVGCTNLTQVSSTLFSGVTKAKKSLFRSVFDKCSSLGTVPDYLFAGVSGSAESMFRSAFYECTSLYDIPGHLFAGIDGPAKSMFQYTFYKTTSSNLSDKYIPPTLFAGLHNQMATDLFTSTFQNSALLEACPSGTTKYTGYPQTFYDAWYRKVSCEPIQILSCEGTQYKSGNSCLDCPIGYDYDDTDGKTSISQCTMFCEAGTWTGEYEKLEYIETTGTQYIDTGHLISTNNLSADFEISSGVNVSGNIGHFAGNQDALNGHCINFKDSKFGLWVAYIDGNTNGSKTTNGGSFQANTRKVIHYKFFDNQRTLTVDGSSKTEAYSGSIISNNTYRLFSNGCLNGCNDKMLEGRMHWFKLYENDNLVFDFIPVRKVSNGEVGMYDLVSGQFFTNDGTGDFIAGPVESTIGGSVCENVGYGYYSSDSVTGYGSISTRNACGEGEITNTENSTSIADCRSAANDVVCAAGTYLAANDTVCTTCPVGSWCPGGVLTIDTVDNGIQSCATEIGSGWTSIAGSSAQTDCYYLITLDKNGFSGVINANAGSGCYVVDTAEGTNNAQLKLFYNTRCVMPAINLIKTGYSTATGWATSNTVGAANVVNIPATTTTPDVTTYFARKNNCAANFYKTSATVCSACPAHSNNASANTFEYCTCDEGYTADGSSNGATTSANACIAIGNMSCAPGKYVPAGTELCEICPVGSYCAGGNFTINEENQGIKYCADEINVGWTSVAGKSSKSDCYYPVVLNKNGFSGNIPANAGTGCQVLSDANGTNDATLQLFYNTACTLPTINLEQTGYSNATSWTDVVTLGGDATIYSTIPATTIAPEITTYYAYKASCAANSYKSGLTQCSACGVHSTTFANNLSNTCTCLEGFTVDGTSEGATTGTSGCIYVVEDSTYLHAGENLYKVLTQRRTTPSICLGMDNKTYYVSLVPTEIEAGLAVEYNNKTYSGCNITNDYCVTNGKLYWVDPLVYLKSNGTQYINTGVVPDLNTAIEIEMADTTSVNTYSLFGVKTGFLATTDEGFGISLSDGNFGFFRNGTSVSAIPKDNNYHVYYLSNTAAYIDGVPYNFSPATEPISGQYPMYMFGFNHNGNSIDKTLSIKYLKIWSGITLIHHFVPVPSGLVIGNYTVPENGMFDIVTQQFYGKDGGISDFQYGKEQN